MTSTTVMDIFISSNGDSISYRTIGPNDGKPIFLIGGMGYHRDFVLLFQEYTEKLAIRLISFDRPLSGLSTQSNQRVSRCLCTSLNERFSRLGQVIQNAIELLKYLKVTSHVSIIGQSCGAVFALELAKTLEVHLPGSVHAVFLISPWVSLRIPHTRCLLK